MFKTYKLTVVEKTHCSHWVVSEKPPSDFKNLEDFYHQAEFDYSKSYDGEIAEIYDVEEVE